MREVRLHALQNQIKRSGERITRLERTGNRSSWISVGILFVGIPVSSIAGQLLGVWIAGGGFAITALLFGISFYYHGRINKSIARHQAWLQIKSAHIARMILDWDHIPISFPDYPNQDHPFESDLDIVGEKSLHHLIDTSVSYEGSQLLRNWLTQTIPNQEQISHRQQLVRELAPMSRFRDKLSMNTIIAATNRRKWEANRLVKWLEQHKPATSFRPWLLLLSALASLNIVLLLLDTLGPLPTIWPFTFLVYFLLVLASSKITGESFNEVIELEDALRELYAVFHHLETFSYKNTPHLIELCSPFLNHKHRPSEYLARVTRVMTAMGVRSNPLAWFLLNAMVPWDLFFSYRLNQHKSDIAQHAPAWMDIWFELEALSSLANFAYLNPGYTLPDVITGENQKRVSVFRARCLGHPLLIEEEKVCNDFVVNDLGRVALITGSNMAGKSVFLRTVGINLALAYAGGPVNARSLQTTQFRMFTCIRVNDSVTSGISFFYAEVKRLKLLLSELEGDHALPLFFFIDEIFRGTNNRERLIGSRSFIKALTEKHGIGLISTHDLELVNLENEISKISNYHFRDDFADGRMIFDYTLRSGPCPTTNALKIMQGEGLPVRVEGDVA